ncbi:hypothetical protein FQN55_008650 [Onygenales sp. PD_40]|nr:hypothetical protein FQN55_008650 [Onygenales sp. PD_40]KAK2787991.1 hypothetical protein FQN52_006997 [Onygenales sp. PD_12]
MPPPHPKKRKLGASTPAVAEIVFDTDARQDYLSGFHKRKVQRAKHAQEIAEKKAKEEKREQRRKIREDRRAEFERAIEENKAVMREISNTAADLEDGSSSGSEEDEDGEWQGIAEPPPIDYEAEYIDEDKYTTVTVEELDPSKEGLRKAHNGEGEGEGEGEGDEAEVQEEKKKEEGSKPKKRPWAKNNTDKPKKKKKKFRYENKAERRVTKLKERSGNKRQAKERRGK